MSEKMWFAWERDFANRWVPVCYHGDKPGKRMEYNVERSAVFEVPPDCIDGDDVMFGRLTERFPPPQEKKDEA